MFKDITLRTTKVMIATLIATVMIVAGVSAAHFWRVDINTPYSTTGGFTNNTTANVEYKVLSTSNDSSDEYSIDVKRNGAIEASGIIAAGGDSDQIAISLPSDGEHKLQIVATSTLDSSNKSSKIVTVTRDTVAPAAPEYGSSTQSGSTFKVSFEAPSDATQAIIYASKNSTFTANSQTEVGRINVTGTQPQSFTYTASDSDKRFHAVQVVDKAGNASPLVGDSETVIQNRTVTTATQSSDGTTATTTFNAQDTDATGEVPTDTDGNDDQIEVLGVQDNDENSDTNEGNEPSDDEAAESENSIINWLTSLTGIITVALGLGVLYLLFKRGIFQKNNPFKK